MFINNLINLLNVNNFILKKYIGIKIEVYIVLNVVIN